MAKKSTIGRTLMMGSLRAGFAAGGALAPGLTGTAAARLFLSTRRHPVPERDREGLAAARRWSLDTLWGPLAAWTWGAEEGPTIALLHGWEGRAAQLGGFAAPLTAAGFRVVALDAPGHGESPGRSSSLVAMGRALLALGEHVGPLAGVVAHSAGTVAAIHALRRGLAAERLVSVAPGVDLEDYARGFARLFGLNAAVSARMRQRIERVLGVHWEELDPRRTPRKDQVPLLVVHDRGDREAPFSGGGELAEAWSARLIPTEGLGHTRILRDPAVLAAATAFLLEAPVEQRAPRRAGARS